MPIRAEEELILACARTTVESETAERIGSLAGSALDWGWMVDVSLRNGVGPLLYKNMRTLAPFAAPPSIMETLQRHYYQNIAHNLALEEQLSTLLRHFQAARITAIPYKGPTLAAMVYGNIGLRVFGDLDILIQKEDVRKAADLMIALGYRSDLQFSPEQLAAYVHHFNELPFTGGGRAPVELQWQIVPDHFVFPVEPFCLWDDRISGQVSQSDHGTIPAEKQILMLCAHGAKDSWGRLAWVCDIAELLHKSHRLDRDGLMNLAAQTGGLRMLYLGLHLAHELLEAPVPEELLRRIDRDHTAAKTAEIIRERIFGKGDGDQGVLGTCLFYVRLRERFRDKARFFLRTFSRPIPGQWDQLGFDGSCARLRNVIRHMRMGCSYGLGLAKQRLGLFLSSLRG
ncbi:MAG: nucleotidyltransferase family protein [Syntrophorhabdales bacterium]|jgi:hypothetical protein